MMIVKDSEVRQYLSLFLQHYNDLSHDDCYNRFFHVMSPGAIRDWLLSFEEPKSVENLFSIKIGSSGIFEGIAQLSIDSERSEAEIAISIIPAARGKGTGSEMIKSLIQMAKESSVKRLVFSCEASNHSCRKMFSKLGFTSSYNFDQHCVCGYYDIGE